MRSQWRRVCGLGFERRQRLSYQQSHGELVAFEDTPNCERTHVPAPSAVKAVFIPLAFTYCEFVVVVRGVAGLEGLCVVLTSLWVQAPVNARVTASARASRGWDASAVSALLLLRSVARDKPQRSRDPRGEQGYPVARVSHMAWRIMPMIVIPIPGHSSVSVASEAREWLFAFTREARSATAAVPAVASSARMAPSASQVRLCPRRCGAASPASPPSRTRG